MEQSSFFRHICVLDICLVSMLTTKINRISRKKGLLQLENTEFDFPYNEQVSTEAKGWPI